MLHQFLEGRFGPRRAIENLVEGFPLRLVDKEVALIEQGLLGDGAGTVEDELGERLVGRMGGATQQRFLSRRRAQAEPAAALGGGAGFAGCTGGGLGGMACSWSMFVHCTNKVRWRQGG